MKYSPRKRKGGGVPKGSKMQKTGISYPSSDIRYWETYRQIRQQKRKQKRDELKVSVQIPSSKFDKDSYIERRRREVEEVEAFLAKKNPTEVETEANIHHIQKIYSLVIY